MEFMNTYRTEFIGTFFLVLTIGYTVIRFEVFSPLFARLAIGCAFIAMVYGASHVSRAYDKLAVTLAVFPAARLIQPSDLALAQLHAA